MPYPEEPPIRPRIVLAITIAVVAVPILLIFAEYFKFLYIAMLAIFVAAFVIATIALIMWFVYWREEKRLNEQ